MSFSRLLLLSGDQRGTVVKTFVSINDLAALNAVFIGARNPRCAGKIYKWDTIQQCLSDPTVEVQLKRIFDKLITTSRNPREVSQVLDFKELIGWKLHIAFSDLTPAEQAQCVLDRVNSHAQALFLPVGVRPAPQTDCLTLVVDMAMREQQWNFTIRGVYPHRPAGKFKGSNLTQSLGRVFFHPTNPGE